MLGIEPILSMQRAFGVVGTLMLTAYMFPKQALVKDLQKFDYIVVGAGSAGSVVADRLSECPDQSVLVIEAGGDPPFESMTPGLFNYLLQTKYDWNLTAEKDEKVGQSLETKAINLTIGRVLGGSSSLNFMMYSRGCPGDYDSWAQEVQDDTWSYENVLPYFMKSERLEDPTILKSKYAKFHGKEGFLGITSRKDENTEETTKYLNAFKEAGNEILLDVNGRKSVGYTMQLFTISNGVRQTTAYTNLGKNKDRKNLYILKNTVVTKILFDENNNAIGVRAVTSDNKEITILARKEVIVSAGALNTPKLLMLSGVGPKKHLQSLNIKVRSDLPVGYNLQDHFKIIHMTKMDKSDAPPEPINPTQYMLKLITGYSQIDKSLTCAQYQTFNHLLPHDTERMYLMCKFNWGYEESICRRVLEASKGRNTLFTLFNILHPKSRGRVMLRSKNPHDPPKIDLGLFTNPEDVESFADYLLDYVKVLNTTYFRSVEAELVDLKIERCSGFQFASRLYWKCYAQYMATTMLHYCGTCALSTVVDSHLRVFGVQRLRVADNSVMPTITSGNTNVPAIMIGEKAADFIKEDYPTECTPFYYVDDIRKYFYKLLKSFSYCNFFDL